MKKKEDYKKYEKVLKKIINHAKNEYDRKQIQINIGNQRNLWTIINNKIGGNYKKSNSIKYIIKSNKKITDTCEIAEQMNQHFCDVGIKLKDKIISPDNLELKLPDMDSKSFFMNPTNHQEVMKIISNMKNKNHK